MIKPFLGEATIAKLRIFGHDPKAWKSALLEEIDADQLPAHYGGSQRDPDGNPMCLTKVIVFIFQYFIFFREWLYLYLFPPRKDQHGWGEIN